MSQPAPETNVVVRGADGLAYRRSVQLFFVNEHGQFLVCCPVGPGNQNFRQTVQGGSEPGESPLDTAVREAWEEIGLELRQTATFLTEVLPQAPTAGPHSSGASVLPSEEETSADVNERGELVGEARAAFRYPSKKWRKEGIFGQELYPLLFFLPSQSLQLVNVHSRSRGVRQEFRAAYWGTLEELARCAPPVKQSLMANVCPAVAAAVLPYLIAPGYVSSPVAAQPFRMPGQASNGKKEKKKKMKWRAQRNAGDKSVWYASPNPSPQDHTETASTAS